MQHHWQYSWGACSRSKVPIALYGKMLTRLPRLSLSQLRPTLRSSTECTCRRDLQLSHRPHVMWETHLLLVVCRVAVSMSFTAQWLSHCAPSVGTQLALGQTSMSPDTESLPPVTEPPSAPGQRPPLASMAQSQLARRRRRRPRHCRRPRRLHPRLHP